MTEVLVYQCPNCGGKIEFDSTLQKMKCPYCDMTFEVETLKAYDQALNGGQAEENMAWEAVSGSQWQEGEEDAAAIYHCDYCGGEIVCERTTAATVCPYCGNPVVMVRQCSGELRPDCLIPFRLDKEAAKAAFSNHLKGKRLLPKRFKEETFIDEIKGIYVPFWLFDTQAHARIRYRATKARHSSDSDYYYTETKYYEIIREGEMGFERIPADGSSKMADDLMESLEPYDFKDAVDFQTAYLAGYLADKYDVTAEASVERVNGRIKQSVEKMFAATISGYQTVHQEDSNIRLHRGSVRYALYPVWMLNATWNQEKYTFAMNGQTGRLVGDLPLDRGAFWKWLLFLTGICSAGAFLILFLLWWFVL